ncbi:MAG: hypothetical protein JO372_23470 [Solirubrobacterales bacterium]|nr:hypothetical protein [Solirubrobacterales bacterium]
MERLVREGADDEVRVELGVRFDRRWVGWVGGIEEPCERSVREWCGGAVRELPKFVLDEWRRMNRAGLHGLTAQGRSAAVATLA